MKRYQQAVAHIRDQGPMTIPELAASLRWTHLAASSAVARARFHVMLIRVDKQPSGHLVFGAVQGIDERG